MVNILNRILIISEYMTLVIQCRTRVVFKKHVSNETMSTSLVRLVNTQDA